MVFAVALVTGSAVAGAQFLMAFGLGTLPLLFLVHSQYARIARRISPIWTGRIQRGLALSVAIIIAWRLSGALDGISLATGCPFCP